MTDSIAIKRCKVEITDVQQMRAPGIGGLADFAIVHVDDSLTPECVYWLDLPLAVREAYEEGQTTFTAFVNGKSISAWSLL